MSAFEEGRRFVKFRLFTRPGHGLSEPKAMRERCCLSHLAVFPTDPIAV